MIIYHGSINRISVPTYGFGASTNDYGRGFYCTEDIELAKEWACLRGTDGYANQYSLNLNGLNVLDLNGPKYNILNWLALLTKHRSYWEKSSISEEAKQYLQEHFLPSTRQADVIHGYRADDSYFTFAKNFMANGITLKQLARAMQLGNLGKQIVLVSQKSFQHISFQRDEYAPAEIYVERARQNDEAARKAYRKLSREGSQTEDIFMADIIRRSMTNEHFLQ